MTITPHDIGTFLVSSETRDGHHIVDMNERTCSCEAFNFGQNPCKHLDAVRAALNPKINTPFNIAALLSFK